MEPTEINVRFGFERIFIGGHMANLPVSIHLVADAPMFDGVRFRMTVGRSDFTVLGIRFSVRVFEFFERGFNFA